MTDIAVLVGSLRKESLTRKVALALAPLAPTGMNLNIVEIGDLALYDEDIEQAPPTAWRTFRDRIQPADGVLFATPEYNRSVPGCLKNAIDVGSRPYGKGVLIGKPAAVMSVSPSALGGFGANHHLRQSLVFLNMPVVQQPEVYLGNVKELLTADGHIGPEATRTFLSGFLSTFADLIARMSH